MNKTLIAAAALACAISTRPVLGQSGRGTQASPKKATSSKKAASETADRRLTLDQISKLVAIQTPDQIVAQEIQSRGISNDYGRRDVDALRQQGAGSETVAALLRFLPSAGLTVRTEPGSAVKLDGTSSLVTGSDGTVTFPALDPGSHQIAIEKQYFRPISRSVVIKARENASIDVSLEWAVGFLSVSTNVSDAQIRVGDGPPQPGRVSRMAIPTGQTIVAATAPLRKPLAQTVSIEPGKETAISLSLAVDDVALNAMANQIHESFRSRSYPVVIQQAERYFQNGGTDREIRGELAVSYLERGNYMDFRDMARQALSAGGTLQFEVVHHHLGLAGGTLHRAELRLSAETIGFKPLDRCNLAEFQTPLRETRLGKRELAILAQGRSVPVIDLSLPEPSNPKKQVNVNLSAGRIPEGSSAAKLNNSILFHEDPGKVGAIRQLLQTMLQ